MLLFKLLVAVGLAHAATIQRRDYSSHSLPTDSIRPDDRTWVARIRDGFFKNYRKRPDDRAHATNLARYMDDIVLRFNVTTEIEARALGDAIDALYLDIWSATKEQADIRIHQGVVPLLLGLLPESMQHSHTRLIHNLAQTALDTYPSTSAVTSALDKATLHDTKSENLFFQDYQPLSVVYPWMSLLQAMYPGLVEIIKVGTSFEGRDIQAFKLSRRAPASGNRQTVLVNGAAHAREWISTSTVCWMAHQMITATDDKAIDSMLERFDWIFIPTLNVDGYVYTWEHDRLWRKNRQPTTLSFCRGIDLDRSYAFHFDDSPQSSSNPCSDMFPGAEPFEAVESRAFADWAANYTSDGTEFVGLLDFHSYSQQILYPYSWSCDATPPDLENLTELGFGLAKAIRLSSGEHYTVTSACEGTGFEQYPGTTGGGSMLDYMYTTYRIPNTFQIKLRDTGTHGFLLPPEHIPSAGDESINLLKYFAQFILDDGSPTMSDEL